MALSLRRGHVSRVLERHADFVRCEVDGVACVAYPSLTGPVDDGDEVLVNVQARELGLGSGGFDVVYANLTQGLELPVAAGAHVMALPYAPGQWAVRHAEEDGGLPASLDGLPVVLCTRRSHRCASRSLGVASPTSRSRAALCRSSSRTRCVRSAIAG
jgi:Protein of unknown function (DUF3866)